MNIILIFPRYKSCIRWRLPDARENDGVLYITIAPRWEKKRNVSNCH